MKKCRSLSQGMKEIREEAYEYVPGDLIGHQELQVLQAIMEWSHSESGYYNPWFTETFYLRFCKTCNFDFAKTKMML